MKIEGIEISHPEKTLYPNEGVTKKEVAEYYGRIADHLLTHGKSRPLTFRSFPNGIEEDGFFSKNMPDHFPDSIPHLQVPTRSQDKAAITMAAAEKPADLIYFAGQNVIELHASLSTGDALEEPDRIVFDFDPSDDDFNKVRRVALAFKQILDAHGINTFVNTTGSRGLHVHIPLRSGGDFNQSKAIANALAGELHEKEPELTTLEQRKDKRGAKIYLDTLRNAYGQTFVLPYSLRAKKDAPVATPLRWDELESSDLAPRSYTLNNIFQRLGKIEDPWESFARSRQSIDTLIAKSS